ncbi:MAG TPA: hypothetical protein PKD10_05225 [Paracoccaceae bacterium]|nr:hypothetical protein [Paracoccaceae bacterium]
MAIDEIQQIAQARAEMLLRGFEPLRILLGPAMARRLRRGHPEHWSRHGEALLDMPARILDDMEGFAVVFDAADVARAGDQGRG